MWLILQTLAVALAAGIPRVLAVINLDLTSQDSIKNAASTIAWDMMTYYQGNVSGGIPGVLPGPPPNPPKGYYWWESGAMWGTLIDYWYYTGDTTYNDEAARGMIWQKGENEDLMPSNWSQSMGNDDQGFWAMTMMTAAETNFQNPPAGEPGWLALVQAVFNEQAGRYDEEVGPRCGGGLRWQVYPYLTGYNYKNSIANGCLLNIASRLARYTGNDTYATYAEKIWDWQTNVGYIDADYFVYDGAHIDHNCTDINKVLFSYNAGVYMHGLANMYDYTNGSALWKSRLDGIINQTLATFFINDIAYEVACEPQLTCTTDMFSFKAYLLRWMAATTKLAPYTKDLLMPRIQASATSAAKQCTGGDNGRQCGLSWSSGNFDGTLGVGQQMAAMSAIFTNLVPNVKEPFTNATGGTSTGNPSAGNKQADLTHTTPITTADRAGAGIITLLVLMGCISMLAWVSM